VNTCPVCGGEIDGDRVIVSLDTNTLTFRGRTVHIPQLKAEIMIVIAAARPHAISSSEIIRRVWGASGGDENLLATHMWRLRQMLPPGLAIATIEPPRGGRPGRSPVSYALITTNKPQLRG
jgi:DNA-binding winged helix-turn-helix (wHTH) protein